jgi:hypothetical protein
MGAARGVEEEWLSLPLVEEIGDGGGVHVAHVSELGCLLGVEKLAVGVEDGESGNSLLERDIVLFGYVEVFVEVSDVYVDEEKVFVEEFQVGALVEVNVEDLAVTAPVATKVENDTLVLESSLLESGSYVGFGIGLRGV